MKTISISIEADEIRQEILISDLSEMAAEGFEQTESHLIAYFPSLQFSSYEINERLKGFRFELQTLEDQNWNAVWESNFEPVVVEDFCGIRAGFHPPVKGVAHEIVITPKMSFGTGHHATTWMMIAQMREISFDSAHVLDFGTGTGVLAILAEKLGAAKVEAIDIDEWSIENAIENAQVNGCSKIRIARSAQLPEEKFGVILANINRNVILDYLPLLKTRLDTGGKILLSGLLKEDEAIIVEACSRTGLLKLKQTERNNWVSLLFLNENMTGGKLT